MKEKIRQLALQAGGSHYPEVGGELLQKFADLVVAECVDAASNADIRHVVYTTFDKGMADSIKSTMVNSINERFKE